ncbi:S9 family peptidase [Sphingosinithalassobacter portus]|uniref:S9 family peptidase n=1 Tax=Stakelama portus TaxID=2676234 RepID=UPI000D6DD30F|nr:prolyl oligopeptidase family serine peptidase [Sphingosinithalassobacter portus]
MRRSLCIFLGALAAVLISPTQAQISPRHSLTLDDVLDIQRIDRATLSPDGSEAAVVVVRPARAGEVYGRTDYETDVSRADIWLIDTRTGARRAITDGSGDAAGSWCASWSPDGQRLAFLSTRPEAGEPRGGDNVRLYVWDRATGRATRVADAAVMTQTRYGSAIDRLDLRGGAGASGGAHACNLRQENAPFLWLDSRRLLVATLPEGAVSALIDQYGRPFAERARSAARLREGREPTLLALGSGDARVAGDESANRVILRIADVARGTVETVASVPTYPFRSALSVSVAPDGRTAAVLATLRALAPVADRDFPNDWNDDWLVERRLGFVSLRSGAGVRWIEAPPEARLPIALGDWRGDGIAFTARSDAFAADATWFVASANGEVRPAADAPATPTEHRFSSPTRGELLDDRPDRDTVLWSESGRTGLVLHLTNPSDGATRDLLTLDGHLAEIDWGDLRLIDYTLADGAQRSAIAVLPPGYQQGRRYPTLVWIYPGYRVVDIDHDLFTDPFLPGFYNLQLYAARGYVVVVPSMPLESRDGLYASLPAMVLPAVDRMIELGIADPERVGVFGQSLGGYGVYALMTQTDRFRAAVAIAGISDVAHVYGALDPGAIGYPGIAHEKSPNWTMTGQFGRAAPPWRDREGYDAISPLREVDTVTTPLLMIHGDLDTRGTADQAEQFFFALYRQGKTARLLRYSGESHGLRQSPANVRSILAETMGWFDAYLAPAAAPASGDATERD